MRLKADWYAKIARLLARVGQQITWQRGVTWYETRGLVLPYRHQARRYREDRPTPEGWLETGYFRYIGLAEGDGLLLRPGDIIGWNGQRLLLRSCEPVCWGERPVYLWGMAQRCSPSPLPVELRGRTEIAETEEGRPSFWPVGEGGLAWGS